ncbi:MAG: GntR family transcriptional regulator [Spirochaetales bacterium]|nr:GntR family transcriptional regulator [Spirochaetales bacterium]
MTEIGKINTLTILKKVSIGFYLDGGELGEILIPAKYVPPDCSVGDDIDVFVYRDTDDRIIATTETPAATVGQAAFLKVIAVNQYGAFCDWGLVKDLLVPYSEQKQKMEEGKSYIVFVFLDRETNRIAGSSRLAKFIDITPPKYEAGEEVDLLITNETDIGFNAIINNAHWGLLYKTQIFQELHRGQKITGYINKMREDNKIDLILQKPGYGNIDGVASSILEAIKKKNGFLDLTDKSAPEKIYDLFGVSKKAFKMAVGALYKQKLISIEKDGLRLVR